MKKIYQKPEIELISLLVPERIATNVFDPVGMEAAGDGVFGDDGELGLESSIFN